MVRSFIAIEVPDSTKGSLDQVGKRLRHQMPDRSARWTRLSGIHLTLKFLGNVAQADLEKIKGVLTQVGQRHAPFTLIVGGLGCFPNEKRPRVVWVGVQEETGSLAALERDVEKSLVPLGFPREKRAFHPHLTLGRTRRDVRSNDQRRMGEIIASSDVGELDRIRVGAFHLIRSDLRPDGAVYTSLALFDLGKESEGK